MTPRLSPLVQELNLRMKSFQKCMNHFTDFHLLFNLTFMIIPGGGRGWYLSLLFVVNGRRFGAAGGGETMWKQTVQREPRQPDHPSRVLSKCGSESPPLQVQVPNPKPSGLNVLPHSEFVAFLKGKIYTIPSVTASARTLT